MQSFHVFIEDDHLLKSKSAILSSFENKFVIFLSNCLLDAKLL